MEIPEQIELTVTKRRINARPEKMKARCIFKRNRDLKIYNNGNKSLSFWIDFLWTKYVHRKLPWRFLSFKNKYNVTQFGGYDMDVVYLLQPCEGDAPNIQVSGDDFLSKRKYRKMRRF